MLYALAMSVACVREFDKGFSCSTSFPSDALDARAIPLDAFAISQDSLFGSDSVATCTCDTALHSAIMSSHEVYSCTSPSSFIMLYTLPLGFLAFAFALPGFENPRLVATPGTVDPAFAVPMA